MKKFLLISSIIILSINLSRAQNAVTTFKNLNAPATPFGVCLSSDGNTMYLTSYMGHNIRKIDMLTNAVSVVAGSGVLGFQNGSSTTAKFSYPTGIAVNTTNTKLYVADNGNSLIREIDLTSNQVTTFVGDGSFAFADGIGEAAKLNQPFDIKMSGDSVLYFSDSENHCIRKISIASRQVTTIFGTGGNLGFQDGIGTSTMMNNPRGIALSLDGNTIYIAEIGYSILRKADLTTNTLSHLAGAGTQGSADNTVGLQAQFYSPNGVTVDPINPNILYVADTYNNSIRKMDITTSEVSTIAGTGDLAFADNTNGMLAKFNYPISLVAALNSQDIYITDRENNRIRLMKTDTPLNTNTEPQAVNDVVSTAMNTAVSINVTSNDTDNDGILDLTSVDLNPSIVGIQTTFSTTGGSFTVNASGLITCTPTNAFTGTIVLNYTINDNTGASSNVATLTVTVIDNTSGITDLIDKNLVLYPNPVFDELTIKLPTHFEFKKMKYKIVDLNGKIYYSSSNLNIEDFKKINIDITSLENGNYIIIMNFDSSYTKKYNFIKSK